ncbi:MAG: hypothetical protein IJU52_08845 [Clostridia bacterium]|nr:hypothetical protein [Clostridia bacterium]
MTREEFNDLHESLCYGHDAELFINETHYFLEWNITEIEVYIVVDGKGERICSFSGIDRFETVDLLFAASINGKTLNENFSDIQIVDIE